MKSMASILFSGCESRKINFLSPVALTLGLILCMTGKSFGQEGAVGSPTITNDVVSCTASTVDVYGTDTIPDDYSGSPGVTETVSDSIGGWSSGTFNATENSGDPSGTWSGTWGSVTVNLAVGANVITVEDNYGGSASTTVTFNGVGSPAWSYAECGPAPCGFYMTINIDCLPELDSTQLFFAYETGSITGLANSCSPGYAFSPYHGDPVKSTSGTSATIGDQISDLCPTSTCTKTGTTTVSKIWHIYLVDDFTPPPPPAPADVTSNPDTATFVRSQSDGVPRLTVSDSQCSPSAEFW